MTNVIRLDANAVALLFPEGSEQRVEITNAVAAELTKKLFKDEVAKHISANYAELSRKVDETVKSSIKEYFSFRGWPNEKYSLTNQVELKIRDAVGVEVEACVNAHMKTKLNECLPDMIARHLGSAEQRQGFKSTVNRLVRDDIREAVSQALRDMNIQVATGLED